ncbi:M20/M25/M40 family metallo-hydrolase [Sphingomonas cavernae]|uniref:Carboxypeptidase Q n=1 Tax=Sphingomonas cavernae TaxID=2320861 RepID=A0A418WMY8_9SPHN|nr:M20/M25/M40 family metallo-hydrolase [Sphingomonas cavernae]RJF91371.1 peptidase M28 family protein [Sphingomonas cavernae]
MKKLVLLASAIPTFAFAAPDRTVELRDAALKDDVAWDITEGLTTEVGQRMPGTEAEARARDWSVKKLKALGFKNVRVEPFDMPVWVRGEEKAEITLPYPQPLILAALGNSGATPASGLEADVVHFATFEDLKAAPDSAVKGKIVFVSHAMKPTQDGSSYGQYGQARFTGPNVAAKKGAAAIVIRSIGTDSHRNPHTGSTNFEAGVTAIPAAALANPDADNLERIFARTKTVRLKLTLTPRNIGVRQSGNVVAEVPGTDPEAGIVLIGGHLDSWDLGTGAIDDASGVAITAAAAKRIMDAGKPRRTIRLVWFGAEEVGVLGGKAYFERHKADNHAVAAESDFGADRIWRFEVKLPEGAKPVADRLAAALAPLGITRGKGEAGGGADVGPIIRGGVSAIDLNQDGTHYFDLHHTPDDTLDKVDPEALRQNVAAWTAMLSIVANAPENISTARP